MEVLSFITTLTVLVYTLFRFGKEFVVSGDDVKLLPGPKTPPQYVAAVSYMTEVQLKGLDYGPPMRYFVQGFDSQKVWLLGEDEHGRQHSTVVDKSAVKDFVPSKTVREQIRSGFIPA